MLRELFQDPRGLAVALLFGGSLGLMASILALLRTAGRGGGGSPGRYALAQWIPIALVGLTAAVLRSPDLGLGVALGTSVAALSSVTGFVLAAGPLREVPPCLHRIWLYLPMPILLMMVLGLGGTAGFFEAGALAIQGIMLGLVWSQREPGIAVTEPPESPPRPRAAWWAIEVPVVLGLAMVAAWAAARGAQQLSAQEVRYPAAVLGATLISATLMLPMISIGTPLAAEGRAWIPLKAQAGVVFLNLGVLAPLIILVARAAGRLERLSLATTRPADGELMFPRMAWRIDSVTLLILSLLFVPAAAGRLRLDRWVGGCLVAAYFIYLVVTLSLGPL